VQEFGRWAGAVVGIMAVMQPLHINGATYHGGFSHLALNQTRMGTLVIDDDALTIRWLQGGREYHTPVEICRTRAIASIEVTSEQAAKYRTGGILSKGAQDRATMIVNLKRGEGGYFTLDGQSTATVLGIITPWMREYGIVLGSSEIEPSPVATAPMSIADELAKLAQLRDSGVLTDDEFVTLKTQLIQEHTGTTP
jgi:hypothetical protein